MELSSCEGEYIAALMGDCQALWLENLMCTKVKIGRRELMKMLIDKKLIVSLTNIPLLMKKANMLKQNFTS